MFGRGIGFLNVYIREIVTGFMNKIWLKLGNVGDYFERVDFVINEIRLFQVEMFYIGYFLSFWGFLVVFFEIDKFFFICKVIIQCYFV